MFDFSTPPWDMSAEERRKEKESVSAASAAIDLISKIMLSDPSIPECRKIEIRIMLETKHLYERANSAFMAFASPIKDLEECQDAYPERQEVLEYIQLMGAGLDSFLAAHPALTKK